MILVPDVGDLRQQCLSLHHDTPYAGHLGFDRTAHLVKQTYWWPRLDSDVRHLSPLVTFVSVIRPLIRNQLVCYSR